MSTSITYENIKPLVASTEVQLAHLYVTFKCPVTGTEILSTARVADMTPVGGHPQWSGHDFDRFAESRAEGSKALAGERDMPFFGVPHAVLHDAEGKAIDDPAKLDRDIVEHGIVRAFEAVSRRFRWDAEGRRYVSAS
jgi:hypothetical protein